MVWQLRKCSLLRCSSDMVETKQKQVLDMNAQTEEGRATSQRAFCVISVRARAPILYPHIARINMVSNPTKTTTQLKIGSGIDTNHNYKK